MLSRTSTLLRLTARTPSRPLSTSLPRFASHVAHPSSSSSSPPPFAWSLPDMEALEHVEDHVIAIPSAPDAYSLSSSTSFRSPSLILPPTSSLSPVSPLSPSSTPSTTPSGEKLITASHPSTYPDGQGPSLSSGEGDVQRGEEGDSTASLPEKDDRSKEGDEGTPLNEEERKGAFKLVGILVAGYIAGTVTDPSWRRGTGKKSAAKEH